MRNRKLKMSNMQITKMNNIYHKKINLHKSISLKVIVVLMKMKIIVKI